MQAPEPSSTPRKQEILRQALTRKTPQEQAAYLDGACGDDAALRAEMEALLAGKEENKGTISLNAAVAGLEIEEGATELVPTLLDETPLTEGPGTIIGRYKLLEQIGKGGFGVVYVAEQQQPVRRQVALKIIKLGMDTRQVVARFEAERQALALMDNPNIAKVFDAGATDSGRPFFVMELVKGIPIVSYCDQEKLSTEDRLGLFVTVCQAIQHAHQKGIIHRDIKPSNILVTVQDGVPVPKVIDFGIAKATQQKLTEKTLHTQLQQFIGTPAYMSPEQAEMSGLDIDTRSDIYSLGVLLYELLVGKTPFDSKELLSAGLDEIRRTIREKEPPRPSTRLSTMGKEELTTTTQRRGAEAPRLINLLRGDLDWIVMKCLEKDRTRRYDTANGLAMDLQRHLNHLPVVARPPSASYRVQKFVLRNKVMVSSAAVVAAVLLLGAVASMWEAIRATQAEREQNRLRQQAEAHEKKAVTAQLKEEQERKRAQAQEAAARQQAYASDMNLAERALEESNLGWARDLLTRHQPRHGQEDLRGWEWRYLWQSCGSDELFTLGGHSNVIRTLAFSPDGKRLATGAFDKLVKIWDVETRKTIGLIKDESGIDEVAFSPDGKQVFTADEEGTVMACNLDRLPDLVPAVLGTSMGRHLAISPQGDLLALCGAGPLRVWHVPTHRELYQSLIEGGTWRVCFAPRGDVLAIGTYSGKIVFWDVQRRTELSAFHAHDGLVLAITFSPDGRFLISGGWDHRIKIWTVPNGEPVTNLTAHASMVDSLAFSADGRTLASASRDQTVRLWDVPSWAPKAVLRGHLNEVWAVAFAPGEQILATGSKDETIKFWTATSQGRTIPVRDLPEHILASSPDGRAVLAVKNNSTALLWDCLESKGIADFTFDSSAVSAFALSGEGTNVALANRDGSVIIRDTASGQALRKLHGQHGAVAISFSPDAQTLVLADQSQVDVWRSGDGEGLLSFAHRQSPITSIAASAGTKYVAAGDADGNTEVWDLSNRQRLSIFEGHKQLVKCIGFYKDILATGSYDATIKLWDIRTAREIITLKGQLLAFYSLTIHPDIQRLAGGGADGSVKIWDLNSLLEVATLKGHQDGVFALGFSKDGNTMISLGADGKALIWRSPTLAEIEGVKN